MLPVAVLLSSALLSAPIAFSARGSAKSDEEAADQRVMIVTTDSSAYCHTLSSALDAHGALPHEVEELKTQGDGMCSEGRVRGGIVRLRRALLMLHKDPPPGAPSQP